MKTINEIELQKLSPALLASYITDGKYDYPKHIAYIDSLLLDISIGKIKRLIVNMPPRHGKSELISKYFPFWYLCNYPDKRIILSSYESTFAQSWGRKVRNLFIEFGESVYGHKLSESSQSAGNFELDYYSGSMTCVGAGGPITGKGADLFIIDDPIKNDEEANSTLQREKLWDWFCSTAYTRLEPNGSMIIMMTRWNEDDLCGRLINNWDSDEKWTVIKIPAIANDDDPIGRQSGTALWEKRFSTTKLIQIEKEIGSYWFEALYQQNPVGLDGGIFKKKYFRYFIDDTNSFSLINGEHYKIVSKSDCTFWTAIDLAISLSTSADYTCAVTVAITPDNELLICDVIRKRIEPSEHLKMIDEVHEKFNPYIIGIESVQYQTALVQNAAALGYPVKQLKPDSDKLTRALPVASKIEIGQVYFNRDANWLNEFENELLKFPRAKHDDQVDALSYAAGFLKPTSTIMPQGKKVRTL